MRRAKKPARRKPEKAQWMQWEPGFQKLFGMAPTAYAPPKAVLVRGTVKGGTFVAMFTDEEGREIRFRTRVGIDRRTNDMWIVDQTFTLTAIYRKGAAG